MAPAVIKSLLVAVFLLVASQGGAEAKYASNLHRTGRRLTSDSSPPLEQHQVTSVNHCLHLCQGATNCVAINFGTISATANCQLLGQRACDGLPLVADAAVDYYDVYDGPQNLTAEAKTPFWNDPGCEQGGYCAAECAAEAVGQFCTVDAHCTAKLKPPSGHQCVEGTCQPSADFWELRTGLALPRWQLWRIDWHVWTWKKLKPGTCTLDFTIKLGVGARVLISPTWIDEHVATRLVFSFTTTHMTLYYHDATGAAHTLVDNASFLNLVSTDTFNRLKISWCGGTLAVGPEDNPTMITGQATVTQPIDFVMVHSTNNVPSWMYVDSGVADRWLFEDSGVAEDAVLEVGPSTYAFRNITPSNDVTVKYDCMAETDCLVMLQGSTAAGPRYVGVCVGCYGNQESCLAYFGDVTGNVLRFVTGPVLSTTQYNTFTVRFNNGHVTIHRNSNAIPIYEVDAPHPVQNIDAVGIGGCCGRKYIRAARYDPTWRTDTWLTEGRGFSASGALP
ncbi:hypothetical protein FJT64_009685 [Amphibalanus amphitrite]|uniref:Apple domain-containing protein n=1 Tax=Amphibalanus amphitrite TaxID=1232801 RepID=A0A6A4VCV9_AMPAM|nr:hypothetical protein FJT64_009685 [Amphibalanus amphitrite]